MLKKIQVRLKKSNQHRYQHLIQHLYNITILQYPSTVAMYLPDRCLLFCRKFSCQQFWVIPQCKAGQPPEGKKQQQWNLSTQNNAFPFSGWGAHKQIIITYGFQTSTLYKGLKSCTKTSPPQNNNNKTELLQDQCTIKSSSITVILID